MRWKLALLTVLSGMLLIGCSAEETTNEEPKEEKVVKEEKPVEKEEKKVEPKEEVKKEEPEIATDVFSYAEKVEVTDAIDTNQHVTVFVFMSEELTPGLATQHVVNQTYDFLQQTDIEGAKTISVNVKQGELKIAMYTVNKDQFVPNDSEPMASVVMKASTMEFMVPEVEEYGKTMELW